MHSRGRQPGVHFFVFGNSVRVVLKGDMKNNFVFCVLACPALILAGCGTTLQVIDQGSPPLVLKTAQESHFYITDLVTFPAGVYTADFKTAAGTFYRAPSKIIHSVIGGSFKNARPGGIFIPRADDPDRRPGVWFDQQEASGGLLGYAASSPTKVSRLRDAISYSFGSSPSSAPSR